MSINIIRINGIPGQIVKRGYVHGSTYVQGLAPASDACTPDDVSATLFHCLGVDPHQELTTAADGPSNSSAKAR